MKHVEVAGLDLSYLRVKIPVTPGPSHPSPPLLIAMHNFPTITAPQNQSRKVTKYLLYADGDDKSHLALSSLHPLIINYQGKVLLESTNSSMKEDLASPDPGVYIQYKVKLVGKV